MTKKLTDVELEALIEIMQVHMDKATTHGIRSQKLIAQISRQCHILSHHIFPQVAVHIYPAQAQPVVQEAIKQVEEFNQMVNDWGETLNELDQEYTQMIDSLREFWHKFQGHQTGGNGKGS